MDFMIERHGGVLTIALSGRLDVAASTALAEILEDAVAESDRAVILDFAKVRFIGSAALRVVLLTARFLKKRDTKLVPLIGELIFPAAGFRGSAGPLAPAGSTMKPAASA